jgi:hypothetical protein
MLWGKTGVNHATLGTKKKSIHDMGIPITSSIKEIQSNAIRKERRDRHSIEMCGTAITLSPLGVAPAELRPYGKFILYKKRRLLRHALIMSYNTASPHTPTGLVSCYASAAGRLWVTLP